MAACHLNHVKSLQKELADLTNYKKSFKALPTAEDLLFDWEHISHLSKTKTIQ